jgi:hypothetical protein
VTIPEVPTRPTPKERARLQVGACAEYSLPLTTKDDVRCAKGNSFPQRAEPHTAPHCHTRRRLRQTSSGSSATNPDLERHRTPEYHSLMAYRDVLIRSTAGGFVVVDASTMRALVGPYRSLADAHANARRLVSYGHVWRETADRNGRTLGRFLLELKASSIE